VRRGGGGDCAQSWLTLSRTEGELPPPLSKKDGHTIGLSVLALRPDVYTTYLTVDTVGNAADVKLIRVVMEARPRSDHVLTLGTL
jgi:hypothetical protein